MKKNTLFAVIAGSLVGFSAAPAFATDGSINFIGEVTETTCQINGHSPDGQVDVDVNLLQVQTSSLSSVGETANATPFKITLGGAGDTNCTNGAIAQVYFEPNSPAIDTNTGALNNTATALSAAQGVQVQILNADTNTAIDLTNNTNNYPVKTIVGNTAEFKYLGQYLAVGVVRPGEVTSTVKYSVVYQ